MDTGRGRKRKPVTGGARTGDADLGGGADGERSEADGMSGAMPPEAASRVCAGTLTAGTGLKTDARAMSGCWLTKRGGSGGDRKGEALAAAVAQTLERDAMVKGRAGPKAGGRPTAPRGVG